jgi:hypothetical protein
VKEEWATQPTDSPEKWQVYRGGLHLALEPGDDVDAGFERLLDEVANQSVALVKRLA